MLECHVDIRVQNHWGIHPLFKKKAAGFCQPGRASAPLYKRHCLRAFSFFALRNLSILFVTLFFVLGSFCTVHSASLLTAAETAFVQEHPELTIALDTTWEPYAYVDKNGNVRGIIPNILDRISKSTGFTIRILPFAGYSPALQAVRSGKAHLLSGIADDQTMAERNKLMRTLPYMRINYCLVTRGIKEPFYAPDTSYRVAVCKDSYAGLLMKAQKPSCQFIDFHSDQACLDAVISGKADLALIAAYAAESKLLRPEYANLYSVLINDFSWNLCFGVSRAADPQVISIVNKGIHQLTRNDINQEIYAGLLEFTTQKTTFLDFVCQYPFHFLTMLLTFLIVLILIRYSNTHEKRKELEAKDIQFQTAMANSQITVWKYDLHSRRIFQSASQKHFYGQDPIIENGPETLIASGVIRPDSLQNIQELFRSIEKGVPCFSTTLWMRFCNEKDWTCERVTCTTFLGVHHKPAYAYAVSENITHEQKTRIQQEKLHIIIRNSQILSWDFDIGTRTVFFSDAEYQNLPLQPRMENAPESIIHSGMIAPDSIDDFRAFYTRIIQGAPSASADIELKDNSGAYVWKRMHLYRFSADETMPPSAIGYATDLTELKRLEEHYNEVLVKRDELEAGAIFSFHLNLTQNRCTQGLQHSPRKDFFLPQLHTVDAFFSFYQEHIDHASRTVFSLQCTRNSLLLAFSEGQTMLNLRHKYRPEDMNALWVELCLFMLRNPQTNDVEAFVYANDINKEMVAQSIIDKLVLLDYEFIATLDVNTEHIDTISLRPSDAVILPCTHLPYSQAIPIAIPSVIAPQDREEAFHRLALPTICRELEKQEVYSCAFFVLKTDGNIGKKIWKYSYLDQTKTTLFYTRSDITGLHLAEERKNIQLHEALLAAKQANQAKSDFLSRMSHEIRTPMNAVIGMNELIRTHSNETLLVQDCADKAHTSALYLLSLINDILDMSRIESGKFALHDALFLLEDCINEIETIIRTSADQAGVHYAVTCDPDCAGAYVGDAMRLKQVILNLLSNAVKFTPKGGRVALHASTFAHNGQKKGLRFSVSDTGIGINQAFLHNLFQPFSQEHSETSPYGGSGLGLAIAKSITEAMEGSLAVTSEKGKGTTFTADVWLRTPPNGPSPAEALPQGTCEGKRVLLVEDHELNIFVAKKTLQDFGIEVAVAENGALALSQFAASPEGFFDAILMDIRMPVMNGLEATRAIRALHRPDARKIPIIAMTANAFGEDVQKSKQAGITLHLSKPINPSLLKTTLLEVWSGS